MKPQQSMWSEDYSRDSRRAAYACQENRSELFKSRSLTSESQKAEEGFI